MKWPEDAYVPSTTDDHTLSYEAIEEARRNIRAGFAKIDAQVIKDDEWLATGRIRLKHNSES